MTLTNELSMSERQALGEIISDHYVSKKRLFQHRLVAGIFALFGILALEIAYKQPDSKSTIVFVLMALVGIIIPACILAYLTYVGGRNRIIIGSEGILFYNGATKNIYSWKKVQKVWAAFVQPKSAKVKLEIDTGEKLVFGFFFTHFLVDFGDCCLNIQRQFSETHLSNSMRQLSDNKPIQFGPFSISKKVLSIKSKELSWNDLQKMEINRGQLILKKKDQWLVWQYYLLSEIPNWWLLLKLISAAAPNAVEKNTAAVIHSRAKPIQFK